MIRQFVSDHRRQGVRNATAILVESRDQAVKALVGSADYFNASIHGQVNGVHASRSPGSTLKPFLYGLALDQGLIQPMSILKDTPQAFGAFQPENFDGRFAGPLTAQDALIRSRNVPAVWLASQLRQPSLHGLLQRADIRGLRGEEHYGLALALGGGELTPAELAKLYLMLAGDGQMHSLRWTREDESQVGPQLLSPQAAFMVRDMLRHNPRPDGLPADARGRNWPVAWKTGTSWGFHDAWSAGLVGPYVLVVWVGNFDATPNPAFVGIRTAAPLFFRIADALPLALPEVQPTADRPPEGLSRVEVCTASGELPNRWCPQTRKTWYIPGVSPIRVSDLHRPVWVDRQTGNAACPPYDKATSELQVFEFWPTELQRLFAAAGLPRRTPPDLPSACKPIQTLDERDTPRFTSPLTQVTYSLRLSQPSELIQLSANAANDARTLFWFADQTLLGQSTPQQGLSWRPEHSGKFQLRVSDDLGRSSSRTLRVEFLP